MEPKDLFKEHQEDEDLLDLDEFPEEEDLPLLDEDWDDPEPEDGEEELPDLAVLDEFPEDAEEAAPEEPDEEEGEDEEPEPPRETRMVGWVFKKHPGQPAEVTVVEAPVEPKKPEPEESEDEEDTLVFPLPEEPDTEENLESEAGLEEDGLDEEEEAGEEEEPVFPPEESDEEQEAARARSRGLLGRLFGRREQAQTDLEEDEPEEEQFGARETGRTGPVLLETDSWDEEGGFLWNWKHRDEEKPEKKKAPLADIPAKNLMTIYGNGLLSLKRHTIAAFLVCVLLAYVNLADSLNLPMPTFFWDDRMAAALGLELLGVILVLLLRPFLDSFRDLFKGEVGMHTLVSAAVLMTVLDSIAYIAVDREGPIPCAGAAGLALCCAAWGQYLKLSAQRLSCRTAAMTDHPSRLIRQQEDGVRTNVLLKREGDGSGFGSQIQEEDGVSRMTRPVALVVLVACAVLSVAASLGRGRADLILWDASVIFTMAAPLSVTIAYGIPYRKIAQRLNRSGAAIAGWDGVKELNGAGQMVVTDTDLFPTGMVACNGLKTYGNIEEAKVVGYAATLIRESHCGLEQTFANLVYTQGAKYWNEELHGFESFEGGGCGGYIRKDYVLVGTGEFMKMMGVELPPEISVKTAAFCAVNGVLAMQFVLIYKMPAYVEPSVKTMLRFKLTPVMAMRDFNLSAELLDSVYDLPIQKTEFPDMDTRIDLTEEELPEDTALGALLGREGLDAHCDTVLGAKRLYKAARRNGHWLIAASLVGMLLGFYLTYTLAFTALQPVNLLVFLILWTVPALLNAYQTDRY